MKQKIKKLVNVNYSKPLLVLEYNENLNKI